MINIGSRGNDLVDGIQGLSRQAKIRGQELLFQLLHGAGADDGRGNRRVFDGKGQGQVQQRQAVCLRQGGQCTHGFGLAAHLGTL